MLYFEGPEKEEISHADEDYENINALADKEIEIIILLSMYPEKLKESASTYSPAILANYAYELCKTYSRFYAQFPFFSRKKYSANDLTYISICTSIKYIKKSNDIIRHRTSRENVRRKQNKTFQPLNKDRIYHIQLIPKKNCLIVLTGLF